MNHAPIPELPSFLHKDDHKPVIEWIKTRPAHDYDGCVNSMSRWKWTWCDHGIWTHITVTDLAVTDENSVFEVPEDVDKW